MRANVNGFIAILPYRSWCLRGFCHEAVELRLELYIGGAHTVINQQVLDTPDPESDFSILF